MTKRRHQLIDHALFIGDDGEWLPFSDLSVTSEKGGHVGRYAGRTNETKDALDIWCGLHDLTEINFGKGEWVDVRAN